MKYKDGNIGSKADCASYLKKTLGELFNSRLAVEGQTVEIPDDIDLEYETKYKQEESGGSVTLKISWNTGVEEEEVETL